MSSYVRSTEMYTSQGPWLGGGFAVSVQGGGGGWIAGPFQVSKVKDEPGKYHVKNNMVIFGRDALSCDDTDLGVKKGEYLYCTVTGTANGPKLSVAAAADVPPSTLTTINRPLYHFMENGPDVDYRWAPVIAAAN